MDDELSNFFSEISAVEATVKATNPDGPVEPDAKRKRGTGSNSASASGASTSASAPAAKAKAEPVIIAASAAAKPAPKLPVYTPAPVSRPAPASSSSSSSGQPSMSASAPAAAAAQVKPNFKPITSARAAAAAAGPHKSAAAAAAAAAEAQARAAWAARGGAGTRLGGAKRPADDTHVRVIAGQVWEDATLADWPEKDFRIFVGQLGNEVNDEDLTNAFKKFPSFAKARAVRKKDGKAAGYGFVSFLNPLEGVRAMRAMQGKVLGTRPMKLKKSTWQDREMAASKGDKKGTKKQAAMVKMAKGLFKGARGDKLPKYQ